MNHAEKIREKLDEMWKPQCDCGVCRGCGYKRMKIAIEKLVDATDIIAEVEPQSSIANVRLNFALAEAAKALGCE